MKKCVFAGTFDPPTKGHDKIVKTCLEIFDEVVVAVLVNTSKKCFFTVDERVELLSELYSGEKRVKVIAFDGAAVDLLEKENTRFYVRGIRNTVDFDYENADYFASKKLKDDLIEIYIPAEQDELHVSSTLVRNSVRFRKEYRDYLPPEIADKVCQALEEKYVRKAD